jgi:hypothetical protein
VVSREYPQRSSRAQVGVVESAARNGSEQAVGPSSTRQHGQGERRDPDGRSGGRAEALCGASPAKAVVELRGGDDLVLEVDEEIPCVISHSGASGWM